MKILDWSKFSICSYCREMFCNEGRAAEDKQHCNCCTTKTFCINWVKLDLLSGWDFLSIKEIREKENLQPTKRNKRKGKQ